MRSIASGYDLRPKPCRRPAPLPVSPWGRTLSPVFRSGDRFRIALERSRVCQSTLGRTPVVAPSQRAHTEVCPYIDDSLKSTLNHYLEVSLVTLMRGLVALFKPGDKPRFNPVVRTTSSLTSLLW